MTSPQPPANVPPYLTPGQLLKQAGAAPKKSWSQNFLRDRSVLHRIVDLVPPLPSAPEQAEAPALIELGAGLGALTYHLAAAGHRVVAVEQDREVIPGLEQQMGWAIDGGTVTIHQANAAKLDYTQLAQAHGAGRPLTVVGNLPYQIASRLLVNTAAAAVTAPPTVDTVIAMVQLEVAHRLAAAAGDSARGLLSILVQRAFDVSIAFKVPPQSFLPPPKVHSAVVVLKRRQAPQSHQPTPAAQQDEHLVQTARAAFSARRKTLRNALCRGLELRPGDDKKAHTARVEAALAQAGIDPGRRAETLTLQEFQALAAQLHDAKA